MRSCPDTDIDTAFARSMVFFFVVFSYHIRTIIPMKSVKPLDLSTI